ncbi:hypothetical protein GCM10027403_14600 [Arthrobacter tecti]
MQDVLLRRGDRVETLTDMGRLKAGSPGIVVEVYDALQPKRTAENATEFEVGVAFPTLSQDRPADAFPFIVKGLETRSLQAGDVVPMKAAELKVTGNIYR